MSGSKQHFLPATYLACFSADGGFPRRRRRLAQGDRVTGDCIWTAAGNLAKITDLYTLEEHTNPGVVDDIWFEYERRLAECIDQLIAGTISALDWASVLVPFVACLLVRGPDFDERLNERLLSLGFQPSDLEVRPDNSKQARIMEIQRLLAPVLVAQWTVITLREGEPLMTNDWAFVAVAPGAGISIPLGRDHVLQVGPRTSGIIAKLESDTWKPVVRAVTTKTSDRLSFNRAMAENARRFLFGSNCALVKKYLPAAAPERPGLEPGHLGFVHGVHAVVHEFVWHRFVSALHKGITPNMNGWDFDFYFEGLKRGWVSPLMFPTNLPEFKPGLERKGNEIEVTLYDAPDPMPTITCTSPRETEEPEAPPAPDR
jgi:hypothetical protein